jgi:ribosomal protein S18 acetylase RimI-like enzyme
MKVVRWAPAELRDRVNEAMTVYEMAMGYPPGTGVQRASFAVMHTRLSGFRAVAALDGDRLAGFGYGYASRPGQWWHEQVRAAIGPRLAVRWLAGGFELCELHVRPDCQGQGIGRELLVTLGGLVDEPRMLLSTPEGPTRAWRLYQGVGFVVLARNYRFPGDVRPFGILGAELPLSSLRAGPVR